MKIQMKAIWINSEGCNTIYIYILEIVRERTLWEIWEKLLLVVCSMFVLRYGDSKIDITYMAHACYQTHF